MMKSIIPGATYEKDKDYMFAICMEYAFFTLNLLIWTRINHIN